MLEGKPHILVVGGADTGRAPILAALLRRASGERISVASAGVLGHAGEPADPNVFLALEHAGLPARDHMARVLDGEALRPADLVIAVDRGTARVARLRTDKEVRAIGDLAGADDIPDPHHMPLGVWIATLGDYQRQVDVALAQIHELIPLAAEEPQQEARAMPAAQDTDGTSGAPAGERAEHLQRIARLLDTARVLPEIVDWTKLAQEVRERLQALAAMPEGTDDLTPGAAAMLLGVLAHHSATPPDAILASLQTASEGMRQPVDGEALSAIARQLQAWAQPGRRA